MQRTSETRKNAWRSLSAKVNDRTYHAVLRAAGDKKPGVWIRELIESRLVRGDFEEQALAELMALRYIVLNGLPELAGVDERKAVIASINAIRVEADQKKSAKAKEILEEARR